MMLQEKIKELCQDIHDSLGKKRIGECFLVDVEFKNESLVIKSLKCLSYFGTTQPKRGIATVIFPILFIQKNITHYH